ncbi:MULTISPECIES: DUF7695 domain-containing protein [unclassified Bacillus (in: firmicutes)]
MLELKSTHDFKYCSDQAISIDGGLEYSRITGELDNFAALTEWEENVQ